MRAVLLLPLITLSIKLRGFGQTQQLLQRFLHSDPNVAQAEAIESRVALTSRMVLAAARYSPISSTCLERSLSIWWLLGRQGISTQLRIGVRLADRYRNVIHRQARYVIIGGGNRGLRWPVEIPHRLAARQQPAREFGRQRLAPAQGHQASVAAPA